MGLNNEANLYFKVRAESVEGDDEKVGREWTRASKAAAGRTEKFVMNICLWQAPGKEGGQVRGSKGGKIWDRVSRAWGKRNKVEHERDGRSGTVVLVRSGRTVRTSEVYLTELGACRSFLDKSNSRKHMNRVLLKLS